MGWFTSMKPEGGASSHLSRYFSFKVTGDVLHPLTGDMGSGADSYNRGTVLGEMRSHWSVSAHCGPAQGSFSGCQPPGRISALIPSGAKRAGAHLGAHSVASSKSPHLPGPRTNGPFLQRQRVCFQLCLGPLPVDLGRCQAGRWA